MICAEKVIWIYPDTSIFLVTLYLPLSQSTKSSRCSFYDYGFSSWGLSELTKLYLLGYTSSKETSVIRLGHHRCQLLKLPVAGSWKWEWFQWAETGITPPTIVLFAFCQVPKDAALFSLLLFFAKASMVTLGGGDQNSLANKLISVKTKKSIKLTNTREFQGEIRCTYDPVFLKTKMATLPKLLLFQSSLGTEPFSFP